MNITFIGNCQTVALCFYYQELKTQHNFSWVLYGDEFLKNLNEWTDKCRNKITNHSDIIDRIKVSDIIIYQEISTEKSLFSNTIRLSELKKDNCKLYKIPSVYLLISDFDNSLKELEKRESENNVDLKVSLIIEKFRNRPLMLTYNHPNTFFLLQIMKEISLALNLDYLKKEQTIKYLKKSNYMELP